jgi:hypothetical protein
LEGLSETSCSGELNIEVGVHAEWAPRFAIGGAFAPAALEKTVGNLHHSTVDILCRTP